MNEPERRPRSASGNGDADPEGERITREVAGRAIRRLSVLEGVILAAAAAMSLLAGAVAALLLGVLGLPFRPTWAVASILFFTVPAVAIWIRDRREA